MPYSFRRASLQRAARIVDLAVALLVVTELFGLSFSTNIFLLVFCILCLCILTLVHELSRRLQQIARLHGKNFRNVVIIGDGQRGTALAARIEQQSNLGYRVLK